LGWLKYFRRRERDRDFALELEAHVNHEIDANIARGMSEPSKLIQRRALECCRSSIRASRVDPMTTLRGE
jgi:hypothetical protein